MKDMFSECSSGEKLDASKFNKTKVIHMSFMFTGCNLESLKLSIWDTSTVTNMNFMFGE
jgi:surface protein